MSEKKDVCQRHQSIAQNILTFDIAAVPSARGDSCNQAQLLLWKSCCHWGLAAAIPPRKWTKGCVWLQPVAPSRGCGETQGPAEFPPLSALVTPGETLLWWNSTIWMQWHTWPRSRLLGEGRRSGLLFPYKPFASWHWWVVLLETSCA